MKDKMVLIKLEGLEFMLLVSLYCLNELLREYE